MMFSSKWKKIVVTLICLLLIFALVGSLLYPLLYVLG